MATEITRVSIDALNAAIQNYRNKKETMYHAYHNISDAINDVAVTWKGQSANKFKDQFAQLYNNLKQTEEQMDNAISKLEQARDLYQQTEEAARTMVGNVDEGNVPTFF